MISFDFSYYKPSTLNEAAECYRMLSAEKKRALYYGGGTEIITMARAESIGFDAVIDIKGIPQCRVLKEEGDNLVIGSMTTLTEIAQSSSFPLLCKTVARIADHTIQGKITLGGNLGGTIVYREAALPLMITNCKAEIMTETGLRQLPFSEVFNGKLLLNQGDFLVKIIIDKSDINVPYNHVKKTKVDKIDYPLISMAANKKDGKIRTAISGAANFPILLPERIINDSSMTEDERISEIIGQISGLFITDLHGSKEYRIFVLKNILSQMYENFKGV